MTKAEWEWAKAYATSPIAIFLTTYLDLAQATGDPDARWEVSQLDYLNITGWDRRSAVAISKTRQLGFSWLLGAEGIGRAKVYPGSLTNIVSINKDEAEEKIRYARIINEALWPDQRIRAWKVDNRGELEAMNGSRVRSHACTPPRGRPGAHHRLDEVAHYQNPQVIYEAAVPGIARAGSIVACSSPWVRGGFHHTLMEDPQAYPDFTRMWVPWWEVFGLCRDVETAKLEAPSLQTRERVDRFGSERLQFLFRNMAFDAFCVECELAYADDSLAWLTWEEIMGCTGPGTMEWVHADGFGEAVAAVRRVLAKSWTGKLFAGYDVARKKDLAVLVLLEYREGLLTVVAVFVLANVPYAQQKLLLENLTPVVAGGCIDATGLGANLAEDMNAFDWHWSGIEFSGPQKAELAVDLRKEFQAHTVLIPPDREFHRDLHAVYRKVTEANNIVYDADRNDQETDGHADRFWALALAVNAATRRRMPVLDLQQSRADGGVKVTARETATGREAEVVVAPYVEKPLPPLNPVSAEATKAAETAAERQRRALLEQMYPGLRKKTAAPLPEE